MIQVHTIQLAVAAPLESQINGRFAGISVTVSDLIETACIIEFYK